MTEKYFPRLVNALSVKKLYGCQKCIFTSAQCFERSGVLPEPLHVVCRNSKRVNI